MIDLGPSTNKGVALLKILHQREASPIVEDHYSRWFFSEAQLAEIKGLPAMAADPPQDPDDHFVWSAYWYTVLRECFVDEALSDALTSGCLQVLNLGAGFDTRFFRLLQPQSAGIHAFEVDLPDTTDEKRRCIESHLGHTPDHLHLVPLNLVADSLDSIIRHGFDPQVPTAVLLQGVSYYLPKPSALALLRFLATDPASGSQLIYDSCRGRRPPVELGLHQRSDTQCPGNGEPIPRPYNAPERDVVHRAREQTLRTRRGRPLRSLECGPFPRVPHVAFWVETWTSELIQAGEQRVLGRVTTEFNLLGESRLLRIKHHCRVKKNVTELAVQSTKLQFSL